MESYPSSSGGRGTLLIGDGVGISNSAITCWEHVEIGNNVLIGSGVRIYDTDFHPLESSYRYGEKKTEAEQFMIRFI